MNVIVIVCDSWHPRYLGCFGNQWIQTPHLDRFATQAVAFVNAYPENIPTIPTRLSWWTGRFGFTSRKWAPLRTDDVVLPEAMWEHNVRSALITDVYHQHRPGFGFGRGFDEVVRVRGQEYDPYVPATASAVSLADSTHHYVPPDHPQAAMWAERFEQYLRNRTLITGPEETYIAQVVKRACGWLEANRALRQPKFLWLDCFDPHEPWDPPEPWFSMYADPGDRTRALVEPVPGKVGEVISDAEVKRLRQTYAGEITFVDKWMGELFGCLEANGYFSDSLILWLTDHGEPLGEHGIVRKCRPWLHEELVHTPWLLHLPEGELAGTRTSAFVQAPDLMPTVLDALDLPTPPSVQGESILPVVRGEKEHIRDAAYLGMSGAEYAIRTSEWSLLVPQRPQADGDPPRGRLLFNRADDPDEQCDLASTHPELADELELKLLRFANSLPPA